MNKSQFNIKISKDLLTRVKRQAIMSGKSLTEHITDLISKSLSNNDFHSSNEVDDIEERLLRVESIVRNREYLSPKIKPFNNSEAINCTDFMRGIFNKEIEKRNFVDKEYAFKDLLKYVIVNDNSNQYFANRFKEIMISVDPIPWTGKELNDLVGEDKCNCPIRKALINWTGNTDFPSQQEICDKGEKLLALL